MPCTAVTINVNESGWWKEGEAFNPSGTPIQAAINAAIANDLIMIGSGSYSESTPFITTADIILDGGSCDLVTVVNGITVSSANGVRVSGISCTGATSILSVTGSNNVIIMDNCVKSMSLDTGNNLDVSGNYIFGNSFLVGGGLNYSTFYNNMVSVETSVGLRLTNAHHNVFDEQSVNSITYEAIIIESGSSNNSFTDSTLDGDNAVISITGGSENTFTDTSIDKAYDDDGVIVATHTGTTFIFTNHRVLQGPSHTISSTANTTTAIAVGTYNYTPLKITPSTGTINITSIYRWDRTGRGTKTFNASASNPSATATIQIGDFARTTPIWLKVNELDNGTANADSGGEATLIYSSEFTDEMVFNVTTYGMTGTAIFDNRTGTVHPNGTMSYVDWVLGQDAIDTTVVPSTGSITIELNTSIINVNYGNSNIGDLNISDLNETMILKDADVTTMMFSTVNNKHWSIKDIEYHIGATSNRLAASANTWTTSSDTNIIFTLYDLYPSSNFDCKYNSISFTTNTSNNTGKLLFNKSTWDTNVWRDLDIYMTTTPYRCADNDCTVDVGDPLMLYLDLNNSNVIGVDMEITDPLGATTLYYMTQAIENGSITWYRLFTDTETPGAYTVDNFYSTKGVSWKQLDSFLTFGSSIPYTSPGAGYSPPDGGTTIIQVGDISDLTLTPPRLDTYALYGGFGEDRVLKYRFIANRNVTSCTVEPTEEHNDVATCEITDGYIMDVYLTINDSRGYSGTLTVRDSNEFVATSDLIVRVIDIGASVDIVNLPVGESVAEGLSPLFVSEDGNLTGIRKWFVTVVVALLLAFLFRSDLFE